MTQLVNFLLLPEVYSDAATDPTGEFAEMYVSKLSGVSLRLAISKI